MWIKDFNLTRQQWKISREPTRPAFQRHLMSERQVLPARMRKASEIEHLKHSSLACSTPLDLLIHRQVRNSTVTMVKIRIGRRQIKFEMSPISPLMAASTVVS